MNTQNIILVIALAIAGLWIFFALRARYFREFIVEEGFAGLLYKNGKLTEALKAGRYFRWGKVYRITLMDVRQNLLNVAGQEVLSADNITLKISLVLVIQIVDAIKAVRVVDNYISHVYSAAQTALREVIAALTLDSLIDQRVAIGDKIRDRLAIMTDVIGVKVITVEVRDVMLTAELRRAFSETLKAKQEGLAALERARGESAALRNLANAARMMEDQPALVTLRFLQTLADPGARQTVVMNDVSTFLAAARSSKSVAPANEA